ncbi:hypothetical protein JA1_002774 [Spathaspora sp. JA1]|nr:hypothetical protein JA1_002774 [Spathaspora sp. JA1]
MSSGDDVYSSNIDEQLLAAVGKAEESNSDMTRLKLEQIAAHATNNVSDKKKQHSHSPEQQYKHEQDEEERHHQLAAAVAAATAAAHLAGATTNTSSQELSEYNIQIPEPIIDSKSKIYPVHENTITANGNLITRPYPDQIFHTREDLNDFIQEFARDNGFGVVIAHSNRKAIYYTCELGGRYRQKKKKEGDTEEEVEPVDQIDIGDGYLLDANTKTKKLKCPFSMTASFKKSSGIWTLKTTCNEHNHPQLDPLSNHPMLRKRSDELNLLILDLYKVGTKPSHIEAKIKEQYPDVLIKREDIYNEIRGYKRKLKKQTERFGPISSTRLNNYRRRIQQSQQQVPNQQSSQASHEEAAVAAVAAAAAAAAANANAFLHQDENSQVLYELPQQQQQSQARSHEEFQRQFNEAESQYQYQYQVNNNSSGNNNSNTTANATTSASSSFNQDLSIDNIDSRLVGE